MPKPRRKQSSKVDSRFPGRGGAQGRGGVAGGRRAEAAVEHVAGAGAKGLGVEAGDHRRQHADGGEHRKAAAQLRVVRQPGAVIGLRQGAQYSVAGLGDHGRYVA